MGVRLDVDAIRANERCKALAGLADNGALALLIAGTARSYDLGHLDAYAVLWWLIGSALIWAAWHVRGLIQPED